MCVVQITGMGAAKMSASSTWRQLWQQDNGGSYSCKHEQGWANMNEGGQVNVSG